MRVPPAVLEIQAYVRSPDYRAYRAKYVLDAIDRLVTRVEMFPVWELMPEERGLPSPIDFLSACEEGLVAWARMPALSKKKIETLVSNIASDAEALANSLDAHATEIRYFGVSSYVANHLASINDGQDDRPLQPNKYALHMLPGLYDPEGLIGPVPIQAVLRALAVRIRERATWAHPFRPTKSGARDAKRTFLARCLVWFFLTNGGKPHWEWVARTVAALTNGVTLDIGHLQKIVPPMQPLFLDPGQEASWYTRIWEEEQDRLENEVRRDERPPKKIKGRTPQKRS